MKKLIITLLCIAILGGGGYFGFTKYKSSKDKKIVVDVVPVNLMAESADMYEYSNTTMDGQIISANSQKIELDNEKLVKKVLVKEGDPVKKGDTILEYDMTVVELEISQKENQVKVDAENGPARREDVTRPRLQRTGPLQTSSAYAEPRVPGAA